MSVPHSVKQAYEAELRTRGYASDPAQLRAVDALERCALEWAAFKAQRSNALKGMLSLIINAVAVVYFAVLGFHVVQWGPAALMAVAGLAGGYLGVGIARRW